MSGSILLFILSVAPIILLIWLMAKKNGLPSYIALPLTAAIILVIQLVYWSNAYTHVGASIVASIVATLVPVSIIFAAILFNRFMEQSGAIGVIKNWLANISPNPVAQLMIIGWAFAFMIEGASGFGTPAAIAAPLLVSLGFPAVRVCIFTLIMNSVPVSFGAVGTPTWYGFSPLAGSGIDFVEIGSKTAYIHSVAALFIPAIGLLFIVPWKIVRANLGFILLSTYACVLPYLAIAQFNDEFPSLVGGAIGMLISVFLASKGIGLAKNTQLEQADTAEVFAKVTGKEVAKALMPFAVLIGLLVLTRIQQLPFKALLNSSVELFTLNLGFADFKVTQSLTFGLHNIFGTGIGDSYKLLYVPCLIPFILTIVLVQWFYPIKGKMVSIYTASAKDVKLTFVALFGAFVMVKLMMLSPINEGVGSPTDLSMVKVIGNVFSSSLGSAWLYFASYLGAVGAFFSGSNTVSNLTFGSIQESIARQIGASPETVLALQSVGGAMGNMVCINNIIAVASVTKCLSEEGNILKRTCIPMVIYGIVAAIVYVVASMINPVYWA